MLAITLSAELEDRLDALEQQTGRSKNSLAEEAILEHVSDLEAAHRAEGRLAAYRSGQSSAVPLEEVMKRYGMEG